MELDYEHEYDIVFANKMNVEMRKVRENDKFRFCLKFILNFENSLGVNWVHRAKNVGMAHQQTVLLQPIEKQVI